MATKSTNNSSRERIGFYSPIFSDIVKNKANILDGAGEINTSSNIDYPRFALGFHHFIHSDKNKMKMFSQFKGKKKVYHVINEFERYIDDYDEDIGKISDKFFSPRPEIITQSFYKMWEMLFYFDLAKKKSNDFSSIHISDGPNPFVQATLYFRDMYCENKKDSYYILASTETAQQKTFQNKYSNNIKSFKDVDDLCKEVKGRVDLITGDRGKEWNTENKQEQESFDGIFEQILCAVRKQKQGGCFVCKFFETFTMTSIKLVAILSQLYDKVSVVKPLTSRGSNSEKYVVCVNFKLGEKDAQSAAIVLEKIYSQIKGLKKGKFLVDVFPNFELENEFKATMININKTVANEQLKSINQMISYIESTNYHGDMYIEHRDKQIKAAKFWCDLFLSPVKELENNITNAQDIINKDKMGLHEEYNRLLKVISADSSDPNPATKQKRKQERKQETIKNKSKSKSKSKSNKKSK